MQLLCAWAVGLLMTGCGSEDEMPQRQDHADVVRIAASVGTTTRTLPDGITETEQQQFVNNDKIAVEATYTINGTNETKAVQYQYADGQWNGVDGDFLTWRKKASAFQFKSFYPADGTNSLTAGCVYADQTTTAAMAKSDYMTATVNTTTRPADCMLRLGMDRQTARLILNIKKIATEFPAGTKIHHVVVISSKDIPASSQKVEISPKQQGDGGETTTYTALVSPDAIAVKIYMTADGTPLTAKTAALEKGKSYTYDLTVGKTKIDIEGIKVNDWNNGETIDGGKTELYAPYLTFTAEGEQKFMMTTTGGYDLSDKFQYSVNEGDWKTVEKGKEVTFGGDKGNLRLRGTNPYGTAPAGYGYAYSTITFTEPTVNVACTGDIRTLLDWRNYAAVATNQARFLYLFYGCKVLTSAPKLPATNLANYCYNGMFSGCTKLESAPELPATTLARSCYESMFSGCTKLTSAPALPAKELATSCYSSMFSNCTNLESAPALPAEKLAYDCYYGMFNGCTKLTSAPALPAKELATSCYGSMFSYCTNLESAPKLSAETLADDCYSVMFYGCTNLSSVTMLAPNDQITTAENCCYNWLYNAGTDPSVTSRTLKIQDKAAYEALKANTDYLPAIWQKGYEGTTVLNASNNPIE